MEGTNVLSKENDKEISLGMPMLHQEEESGMMKDNKKMKT
jgi:hypothetical protein